MNPSTSYTNASIEKLNDLFKSAEDGKEKAAGYYRELALIAEEVAAAKAVFVTDFSADSAARFLNAQSQMNDLSALVVAIDDVGGLSEARNQSFDMVAVFAAFEAGFAQRAEEIKKLPTPVSKRLAKLRFELTEAGLPSVEIERNHNVNALALYLSGIPNHLSEAQAGYNYAKVRGVGHTHEKIEVLFRKLTTPLPQPPPEPAV